MVIQHLSMSELIISCDHWLTVDMQYNMLPYNNTHIRKKTTNRFIALTRRGYKDVIRQLNMTQSENDLTITTTFITPWGQIAAGDVN